jgi:hypothetical protein
MSSNVTRDDIAEKLFIYRSTNTNTSIKYNIKYGSMSNYIQEHRKHLYIKRHFQQYFSYILAVNFICEENGAPGENHRPIASH